MTVMTERTVGELAVERPGATRVFETFKIDYCCGGNRSLEEACLKANVSPEVVWDSLEIAEQTARVGRQVQDWQAEPLSEVIAHIEQTHHQYVRGEGGRLLALLDKVCGVHGKNHPELFEVQSTFVGLAHELTTHMMKEERILFPYLVRMEESVIQKEPILPAPFGTVANPIAMMEHEHDSAGEALQALRQLTRDYVAPEDACISFKTLYKTLAEFEADLHQHIHLENNVLFPRAKAMENGRVR